VAAETVGRGEVAANTFRVDASDAGIITPASTRCAGFLLLSAPSPSSRG
jgi:hypothetical protein